jgi:Sec-independent protein translocase protein TatA
MEILGIGPMEMLLILVIALIVMGPNDMVKTGRTVGRFLRTIVKSPVWQAVQQTSRDLRYLPNKLMREAGMEEEVEQLKEIGKNVNTMGAMETSLTEEISKVSQEIQESSKDLSAWTISPPPAAPDGFASAAQRATAKPLTNPLEAESNKPTDTPTTPTESTPDNAA